jgi:hypothetical protein
MYIDEKRTKTQSHTCMYCSHNNGMSKKYKVKNISCKNRYLNSKSLGDFFFSRRLKKDN